MDFLLLGYDFWNTPKRRRHYISEGFSSRGHKCIFLDPPVSIKDPRFRVQVKRRVAVVNPNLYVYAPIAWLPFGRFRIISEINALSYRRTIGKLFNKMDALKGHDLILFIWDFWEADKYIGRMGERLVVFDIYDNYLAYEDNPSYREEGLAKMKWVIERADVVITSSRKQYEFACELNGETDSVYLIENGVNVDNYLQCEGYLNPFNNNKPTVVYLGGNNFETCPKLDWELIDFITEEQSLNFLFIGPIDEVRKENRWLRKVRKKENVMFTGKIEAKDLPRFMKVAKVGIIPWRLTEFTTWVYPLKINEYFAAGLPVVSTPLPDVVDLRNRLGSIVSIAQTEEDFLSSLREMIRKHDALSSKCVEVAKNNSWSKKVERILYIIKTKLIYSN